MNKAGLKLLCDGVPLLVLPPLLHEVLTVVQGQDVGVHLLEVLCPLLPIPPPASNGALVIGLKLPAGPLRHADWFYCVSELYRLIEFQYS